METLTPDEEYSMAAVIGLDSKKIEEICNKLSLENKFVVPANYNCSIQTVISGNLQAVEEAIEMLKEAGAKRVVKLQTSGPFHTKKLEKAKQEYKKELEKVKFSKPNIKVIKNLNGELYQETEDFVETLSNHIVSPVRFDKAIKLMSEENVGEYIEIGPRKNINRFCEKRQQRSSSL